MRSRGELEYVPHYLDAHFLDSRLLDSKIVHLEKTIQEQAESQRAADQEKDDLKETINSLRADLRTRDDSSSVLRIQLADAQRKADGLIRINRAHEQRYQCESLYTQGRIHGAAECLLEFANIVNEDVKTNKLLIDWFAGECRRCVLR